MSADDWTKRSWGLFMLRLSHPRKIGNVMPWVLNASGECETETDEAEMIAAVHDALIPMETGLREAKMSTQFHGLVDLLSAPPAENGE